MRKSRATGQPGGKRVIVSVSAACRWLCFAPTITANCLSFRCHRRPEFPTGDGGRGAFGWAGRLIAVKGGTTGSHGATAAPCPARPRRFNFLRRLRGLRYSFMSQLVTSGSWSMICVYLCVFAVGPRIRERAGDVEKRKSRAIGFGMSGVQSRVLRFGTAGCGSRSSGFSLFARATFPWLGHPLVKSRKGAGICRNLNRFLCFDDGHGFCEIGFARRIFADFAHPTLRRKLTWCEVCLADGVSNSVTIVMSDAPGHDLGHVRTELTIAGTPLAGTADKGATDKGQRTIPLH